MRYSLGSWSSSSLSSSNGLLAGFVAGYDKAAPMTALTLPEVVTAPLRFTPRYQVLVWGGRRMEQWRTDLPEGPVGESWDLADQDRGMSVVAQGSLVGKTLRELTASLGKELVGDGFRGGSFPLLVKLIDASARLSVQVHPDDALAVALGVGENGKTECWLMVEDGGELFVGTRPGVDRAAFESALQTGAIEDTLNRFQCSKGDFFFLRARTVHALGQGCLLYEVQQSSDVTFRVWDWGRMGLDGKPRPMHIAESLETIDFARSGDAAIRPAFKAHPAGGQSRTLIQCEFFTVEERLLASEGQQTQHDEPEQARRCSIVTCLSGRVTLSTSGGSIELSAMQTVLIPAAARGFTARTLTPDTCLLHAQPVFGQKD